jgi:hypothetical protein
MAKVYLALAADRPWQLYAPITSNQLAGTGTACEQCEKLRV